MPDVGNETETDDDALFTDVYSMPNLRGFDDSSGSDSDEIRYPDGIERESPNSPTLRSVMISPSLDIGLGGGELAQTPCRSSLEVG